MLLHHQPATRSNRAAQQFVRPFAAAAMVLLLTAASAAAARKPSIPASATAAGRRFVAECERDHVDLSLGYRSAVSRPGQFSGREMVISASVNGFVQIGDQTTYMLGLSDGSQASVAAPGDPAFASGASVCALVRTPEAWDGTIPLQLVDMVDQFDAASARPPVSQKPPARVPNRAGSRSSYARTMPTSRSYDSGLLEPRRQLLSQYAGAVRYFNPKLGLAESESIAGNIIWYSEINNIDARLIMAVIAVESGFDTTSRSNKGAMGLGQLMPGTARDLGVQNPYDPEQNIAGAVKLIHWHLTQNASGHDPLALALACYNAGENAVKRYHGVPPFRETVHYVQKVKELYSAMCRGGN